MAKIPEITIKVTLEISAEDREYLDLLKELKKAQKTDINVPIQPDLTPHGLEDIKDTQPPWLHGWVTHHPDFESAVLFDPKRHPWPECVKPWPDERGQQPRDASSGYVPTPSGRIHVHTGDWIMTETTGNVAVVKQEWI